MDVTSYLLGKQAGGGGGQPSLQNKSVTITENGTQNVTADTGYDGLNNVSITTNVAGGGGLDWSAIGYSGTPQVITNGYNYSKNIYDNWNNTQTSLRMKFADDIDLIYMPLVDTSNATRADGMFLRCSSLQYCPALDLSNCHETFSDMFSSCLSLREVGLLDISNATSVGSMFNNCQVLKTIPLLNISNATRTDGMFNQCVNLISIPQLNISNATRTDSMFYGCLKLETVPELHPTKAVNMNNMFYNCKKLTDDSLNNILKTCTNATTYAGTKTLVYMGFNASNYPASRIQALPYYQDFLNAGWTIGY